MSVMSSFIIFSLICVHQWQMNYIPRCRMCLSLHSERERKGGTREGRERSISPQHLFHLPYRKSISNAQQSTMSNKSSLSHSHRNSSNDHNATASTSTIRHYPYTAKRQRSTTHLAKGMARFLVFAPPHSCAVALRLTVRKGKAVAS